MSRAYRALPPSQLAGDAVIPRIGVTVAFRECVLRYLPPTLDEKQRSGYLRLLGLLLVWLRPDPKFDGRFRIYREQVVACLDCKELAERHRKSFSAKRALSRLETVTGIDLAIELETRSRGKGQRSYITVDPRWPEDLSHARRALLYGPSVSGKDLVELVTGEKWSYQHDLREMECLAEQATREAEEALKGGEIGADTFAVLQYMNQRDPELFCRLVRPNIPVARYVAGSLLDIPQRDAALAWARELISRLDEGQTRQALASTLESVDRVLMAGPGSLPYSERRATLDQFLKELTSGERVITAIAELREWCGHLSPSHRDTAARRLATLEECTYGTEDYDKGLDRVSEAFAEVGDEPEIRNALSCLHFPAVAPLCPEEAFELVRALRRALGNLESFEQTCHALRFIERQPKPIYWHSPNTARISARGPNLTGIPRRLRRVLLPLGQEVDLRNAQLAINAARWNVESVLEVLRAGTSIWHVLERDIGMTPDEKDAFKRALYSLLYMASVRRIRRELIWAGVPFSRVSAFLNHPLTMDLMEARGEAARDELSEDVPRDDIPSRMARGAQATEMRLMAGVLRGTTKRSEGVYEILLWQHDGCTLIGLELLDELEGISLEPKGPESDIDILQYGSYLRSRIRVAMRVEEHWKALVSEGEAMEIPTELVPAWGPDFLTDDAETERLGRMLAKMLVKLYGPRPRNDQIKRFLQNGRINWPLEYSEAVWLLRHLGATQVRDHNRNALDLSQIPKEEERTIGAFDSMPTWVALQYEKREHPDGYITYETTSLIGSEEILPEEWEPQEDEDQTS